MPEPGTQTSGLCATQVDDLCSGAPDDPGLSVRWNDC